MAGRRKRAVRLFHIGEDNIRTVLHQRPRNRQTETAGSDHQRSFSVQRKSIFKIIHKYEFLSFL